MRPLECGRVVLPTGGFALVSANSLDSFATSTLMLITHAGPTNLFGGMRSTVLSGRSFPDTQWTGASKCVPVCSPVSKAFQYQAGPRSSYRDNSQILNAGVLFHCVGRGSKGVCGVSGCVRSTTRSLPAVSSSKQCGQDERHWHSSRTFSSDNPVPLARRSHGAHPQRALSDWICRRN